MLYITLGFDIKGKISHPKGYFEENYTVDWLNNPLAKEIIKGIDKSEHIQDHIIVSPVLGGISPTMLSTGCKGTLILLNEPSGTLVSGERFGDNCFPWLSRIGEEKDIYITLHHYIEDEDMEIEAVVTNTGVKVTSGKELNNEIIRAAHELHIL